MKARRRLSFLAGIAFCVLSLSGARSDGSAGLPDLSKILNPAQRLRALDAVSPESARQYVEERYSSQLGILGSSEAREAFRAKPSFFQCAGGSREGDSFRQRARDAYWAMDTSAQYLARRHGMIPPDVIKGLDGGGERHIHGGEDFLAIQSWTNDTVRAIEVPWPPGNVAVADVNGKRRVFLTPFPDGNFAETQLHELDLETGALRAYPPGPPDFQKRVKNSLGVEAHNGVLYVVDHGFYGISDARLVGIDLTTDRVILEYVFDIALGQMPNDLAFIDTDEGTHIFISDTAPGRSPWGHLLNAKSGIIDVLVQRQADRLEVKRMRRFLDGHPIVEDGGYTLFPSRDVPARTWLGPLGWGGVDGIAAYDGRVYFKRMLSPELRSAPFNDIRPETATVVDELPFLDGFHIDEKGNLLSGDVEHSVLFMYNIATGIYLKIMQDARFHWIDETNVVGDTAYVTASHLHEFLYEALPWARRRAVEAARPFYFFVIDVKQAYGEMDRLVREHEAAAGAAHGWHRRGPRE